MLRSAKELTGYTLAALDDDIGKVEDLLFDDSKWTLRYLIANPGSRMSGRRVLISPIALGPAYETERKIQVDLTKDRIRNSPNIDLAQPVSEQQEMDIHSYYGWPYYGWGTGLWGLTPHPSAEPVEPRLAADSEQVSLDHNLRSVDEVTGYGIRTTDGALGHVEDFVIDDSDWQIRYMVVDTKPLWLGKDVLVAPHMIESVDWDDRSVSVTLTEGQIENAPEWDGKFPIDPMYDAKLDDHYRALSYVI